MNWWQTNTVELKHNDKHDYWYLQRGPETFYDEDNRMIQFDTPSEAVAWLKENHPELRVID